MPQLRRQARIGEHGPAFGDGAAGLIGPGRALWKLIERFAHVTLPSITSPGDDGQQSRSSCLVVPIVQAVAPTADITATPRECGAAVRQMVFLDFAEIDSGGLALLPALQLVAQLLAFVELPEARALD